MTSYLDIIVDQTIPRCQISMNELQSGQINHSSRNLPCNVEKIELGQTDEVAAVWLTSVAQQGILLSRKRFRNDVVGRRTRAQEFVEVTSAHILEQQTHWLANSANA